MSRKLVVQILVIGWSLVALSGCAGIATTDSVDPPIADPLTAEQLEMRGTAGGTECEATVSNAEVLRASDTGFACTAAECRAAFTRGKVLTFDCENGRCPVKPNTWYKIRCDDGPVATRCRVKFSRVTGCN